MSTETTLAKIQEQVNQMYDSAKFAEDMHGTNITSVRLRQFADQIGKALADGTMSTHKPTTFVRGTSGGQGRRKGYAASCTCGAVTFGGFGSRADAKAALEHLATSRPTT